MSKGTVKFAVNDRVRLSDEYHREYGNDYMRGVPGWICDMSSDFGSCHVVFEGNSGVYSVSQKYLTKINTSKGIPYSLAEAKLVFRPEDEGGHRMDEYHRHLAQYLIKTIEAYGRNHKVSEKVTRRA